MSSNLKRIVAVAAVGAAGALAPVASASAASPTGLPAFPLPAYHPPSLAGFTLPALPAFTPAGLGFVPPAGSIVGPTIITTGNGHVFTGTTVTTSGAATRPSVP
jgi:hypothetical protein